MKKIYGFLAVSSAIILGVLLASCSGNSDSYRETKQIPPPAQSLEVSISSDRMTSPSSAAYGNADGNMSLRRMNRSEKFNTEEYKYVQENKFLAVADQPLSTFGADVDTAGYTNARRMIMDENRLPVKDAVRVEEFLNYFNYDYPQAADASIMFNPRFEMDTCPWQPNHKLLLIGVQAKDIPKDNLPPSNFVFLIDNSGSMYEELPLLQESLKLLTNELRSQDKVSIVTYGGGSKVLMDSVSGNKKEEIIALIGKLEASGYTPGAAGIQAAYKLAHKNFISKGNNRVILVTDGDFNVGVSSESELVSLIEKERGSAIYLSVIGMGSGNYKDNKAKMLANKGNGNYIYIDNLREARNALVNEMTGRMFTIARDVKFQLEFNPSKVYAYKLLGYELRKLDNADFKDDTVDSGDVGVGHQVTVLYELVMADAADTVKKAVVGEIEPLKFQNRQDTGKEEPFSFQLRYQKPEGDDPAIQMTFMPPREMPATINWNWAGAVAEFALLLRDSPLKGNADYEKLRLRAKDALGNDQDGKRAEFLKIVVTARDLAAKNKE